MKFRPIFKNISVEIISIHDDRRKVWQLSRPHLNENDEELMKIDKMDLPVNNFKHINFSITSSLIFRDLLYHIRPSADWARSNRTTQIDHTNLIYSSEYMDLMTVIDEQLWNYCIDTSINLDIRKDKFPGYMSTDYSFGVDLRTLTAMLRSMKKSIKWLFDIYGVLFLKAMNCTLDDLPVTQDTLFESLAVDYNTKESVRIIEDADLCIITYKGTGSLLAQFIRQHTARVRSTFVTDLINCDSVKKSCDFNQSDLHTMQSMMPRSLAFKLIKTRACWFAKFDMDSKSSWSDIIVGLIKTADLPFKDCIPCGLDAAKCPWKQEQLARCLAANPASSKGEVNPPCPIITGIPELVQLRKAKFKSNSALFKYWEDLDLSFLTMTQEGLDYIRNVSTYGFVEQCDNENDEMNEIIFKLNSSYDHLKPRISNERMYSGTNGSYQQLEKSSIKEVNSLGNKLLGIKITRN